MENKKLLPEVTEEVLHVLMRDMPKERSDKFRYLTNVLLGELKNENPIISQFIREWAFHCAGINHEELRRQGINERTMAGRVQKSEFEVMLDAMTAGIVIYKLLRNRAEADELQRRFFPKG